MIECFPAARADVETVATPLLSVPLPIKVPFSPKSTLPVGVPVPGATTETVAVRVTDWPKTDGFNDEVKAVAVLALLTTCGLPGREPVLPRKFASPP